MTNRLTNQHDGQSIFKDTRDIWKLIQAFNSSRNPNILSQKYAKMRKNAFGFFRGSCHLFYRDLPGDSILNSAPTVWICGDLHLENFGAYKGDDLPGERLRQRQIYFGINDFDEGVLAPCTWDLARLLASIFLAVDSLSFTQSDACKLARLYLTSYTNALSAGRIREIVEDNAKGLVADLLKDLHRRKRNIFLDERTELVNNRRQLKFDREKILEISKEQYQRVNQVIDNWAKTQVNPDFFEVLDVGFRVAGTGSLGLDRYLILVAGKGSPNRNYLLDFKQQSISSLQPYLTTAQPEWENQATRVMKVQSLVRSAPPALLTAIEFNNCSYLLRELQPTQDKIDLKPGKISLSQLEKLIDTMGKVTAFAHLHGSGKLGAAVVQELIDFGENLDWQQDVLIYANDYARQVQIDYQYFWKATQDLSLI
jgi:uncharacterized protein (DUF2252 family)